MTDREPLNLRGQRLLVVEDDYLVASSLVDALEEMGVEVVGPAPTVDQAMELVVRTLQLDGAVLDINLRGERVYDVATALHERGIPFIFATGYDDWVIPEVFARVPRASKPIEVQALPHLLSTAARQRENPR